MSTHKNITILNKNGVKLCSIHCPQGWNSIIDIPIGPVTVHTENGWENTEAVIQWAWKQIFETYETYKERGVTDLAKELNHNEKHCNPTRCIVCNTTTIKPSRMLTLFGVKTLGIQCTNQECSMHHVTIPWQMLAHIKEVPAWYIPKGFYVNP